jgi:MtN3 and saliva related transmembrane protein
MFLTRGAFRAEKCVSAKPVEPEPDNAGGGMLMLVNIIGFLAAVTSTISLIPQVIKMFKTHSVEDLSIGMIINFFLTSILWIIYGIMISSWSVWLTNIIMLIFSVIMLYLKMKYTNSTVVTNRLMTKKRKQFSQ